MNKEMWDALRKAPEMAELVENWKTEVLKEGVSWSFIGDTKLGGWWTFVVVKFDASVSDRKLEPGKHFGYDGTAVSGGQLILHLPRDLAERIYKHAEAKMQKAVS